MVPEPYVFEVRRNCATLSGSGVTGKCVESAMDDELTVQFRPDRQA
jgi:hypothetical protein